MFRSPNGQPAWAPLTLQDPKKRHPDHRSFLWEKGAIPNDLAVGKGKRTDIIEVKDLIDDGLHPAAIARDPRYFAVVGRMEKFLLNYYDEATPDRTRRPRWLILWGEPGTGKSMVIDRLDRTRRYVVPMGSSNTKWFPGYDSLKHPWVVFNEFCGSELPLRHLLEFMDGTPLTVNKKGGQAKFNPTDVIMTSNTPPKEWYNFYDEDVSKRVKHPFEALERRITAQWHYTKNVPVPGCTWRTDPRFPGMVMGPGEDSWEEKPTAPIWSYADCEIGSVEYHPEYKTKLWPTTVDNVFIMLKHEDDEVVDRTTEAW